MKRQPTKILVAIARDALAVVSMQAAAQSDDAVHGAFERMLNHAPAMTAPSARPDDADPLLHALVIPLRESLSNSASAVPAARPLGDASYDSLVAGYVNMLNYTPSITSARATQNGTADPLYEAMVVPLRDWLAAGAHGEPSVSTVQARVNLPTCDRPDD